MIKDEYLELRDDPILENVVEHSGIKGQKKGHRRFQTYDGKYTDEGIIRYGRRKNKKELMVEDIRNKVNALSGTDVASLSRPHSEYNIDKWGTSPKTNILWVSGISGSGKSTIAKDIAKKNDAEIVNIDMYTFKTVGKYENMQSKSFNEYLDKNIPDWKEKQAEAYSKLTKVNRRQNKVVADWFDDVENALKDYSEQQFGKKKIVAEGIQILDDTFFYGNKQALRNQPVIIMDTPLENALYSRIQRDNKSIDKLLEPDRFELLKSLEKDKASVQEILKDLKHSVEDDKGLMHYGKLGMKWGQRLYQNEDGSLTALGRIHYGRQLKKWKRKGYLEEDGSLNLKGYHKLSKKDEKWAQKHNDDIYKIAMDKSRKEMRDYRINQLNRQFSEQVKSGRVGLAYVNSYNKKLAEVLTKNVSHIKTPNLEKTISFIAKRGELGAYMAISDQGSDLSQYKNGIYRGGRVAYRKNVVNQIPAYRK